MTGPLKDIVVLDLTHVLAGPYAAMSLGDLGARIIKVERPDGGDDTRAFPPFRDGMSGYFAAINRGKQSIALDLKADADRALFERLLARADVVLENFRPGVMEKLGYGWDTLHARHPRLIYGAVSGFGHTGPEAGKPAYDMVVQARGGVMSVTGEEGRDPVRVGASIGDIAAGMFLAQGVLAALYERERTGLGRKVDVAMLDGQLAILPHAIAMTHVTGHPPGPTGARHPLIAPFDTFHAEDRLFVIAAGNDALFSKLCGVLGLGELATDPKFATNAARATNAALLKRRIETVTLTEPAAHWLSVLDRAGIPCGPIQNLAEAMADPQVVARHMVVDIADAAGNAAAFRGPGQPIKLSGSADSATRPAAPALDGDRDVILRWLDAAR
ncbi:CoA transferase [Halovulum dunhuangense]|uniref:CoA transferase n=1 Tax=Halovulum dunhuangense TaxID=1505036 RepID=A0A849L2Z0_9RHOB|nr:CoA transferase [Halovulum dunhuangense]NNU80577.1 CoA transferase [Halovulum dunhuangense]